MNQESGNKDEIKDTKENENDEKNTFLNYIDCDEVSNKLIEKEIKEICISKANIKQSDNIIFFNSSNNDDTNKNHAEALPKPHVKFHKTRKSQQTNLDFVLALFGSFGFYQKTQFLLVGCLSILPSMLAYSYVFIAATPKFTCKSFVERYTTNYELAIVNLSENQTFITETSYFINLIDTSVFDFYNSSNFDSKCDFEEGNKKLTHYSYDQTSSAVSEFLKTNKHLIKTKRTVKCLEWLYDKTLYGPTISNQWDLICIRSYLKAATQNAYIMGTAGAIISGIMSDKLGRKKTLIILIVLMIFVLNTTQFLIQSELLTTNNKLLLFTISRLFQGFGQTMYSVSFVLLMEITGPNTRLLAGNIMAYSFAIGQVVLVGLAYFLRDWNKIMWSLAGYMIPFLGLYWLVPESPRWLLNKDKVDEAKDVIKKISKINNAYNYHMVHLYKRFGRKKDEETLKYHVTNYLKNEETSAYIVSLLQEEASKFKNNKKNLHTYSKTLKEIKSSKKLLKTCSILFFNWMVILMVYLGMGMGISNAMDQHINPYLMFLIQACFEFLGIVTCHLTLNRFGRKKALITFMALSSTTIFLIPIFFSKYPIASGVFYLIAKYSISAAQLTCMIFTSETYPTPMRGTGVGLSVCLARVGGVWAPQINVLASRFGFYVPYMIFSALALAAAFLALFLPQTLNKKLPDNTKEAEKMDIDSKYKPTK